jgi:hypothetical protein
LVIGAVIERSPPFFFLFISSETRLHAKFANGDARAPTMLRSRRDMDVETASAIVRLSERVDTLDTSLRQEITDLLIELRDGLAELRAEFREGLAESRRHAVMLNESTREDIRFVAEAVANLTVKVDSLRR